MSIVRHRRLNDDMQGVSKVGPEGYEVTALGAGNCTGFDSPSLCHFLTAQTRSISIDQFHFVGHLWQRVWPIYRQYPMTLTIPFYLHPDRLSR